MAAAAAWAGHLRGIAAAELARGIPGVVLLLAGFFALGDVDFRECVSGFVGVSARRTVALVQGLLLPYAIYALLLGNFSPGGFLRALLYVNLPVLVLLRKSDRLSSPGRDALAVLLIWLPLEFGLVGPIWSWPAGQPGYYLYGPMGVCLAVFVFTIVRRLDGVGYTFALRGRDLATAALCFLALAPIAIPLGVVTGFLHPAHRLPEVLPSLGRILGIFLATGVPEELLFRGLVQNLLRQWTGRPIASLFLASLIFGASHLNNGPQPDWRYFTLATLAGIAYGSAYQIGGTLMAPALTHTLVDSVWSLFFHG